MAVNVIDLKKHVLANAKTSDKIIIISGFATPDTIEDIAKLGKECEELKEYKRECELAKIYRSPYNHMKKWFLERYKEDFASDITTAAE